MPPGRLYVIVGQPRRPGDEPSYPTDPRHYGLNLFKRPISDDEFDRVYKDCVKAFVVLEDAIDFVHRCSMDATHSVYDRVQGKWVYNEAAMWKAFDIDW